MAGITSLFLSSIVPILPGHANDLVLYSLLLLSFQKFASLTCGVGAGRNTWENDKQG